VRHLGTWTLRDVASAFVGIMALVTYGLALRGVADLYSRYALGGFVALSAFAVWLAFWLRDPNNGRTD
jgi:hypothetical protein